VRINQAKIRALKTALKSSGKARQALEKWATGAGVEISTLLGDEYISGTRAKDTTLHPEMVDGVTEEHLQHISRPVGLEKLHSKGITGKGVTVAVVDSGIAPHPDFQDRIVAFRDFTGSRTVRRNPLDLTGHGTHVAGLIAGSGQEIRGVAPEAQLVGLRIASEEDAIDAIDWAIKNKEKYSIDVLNLSLGVDAPQNPAEDKFRKAAERAVEAGIIVVTASGNECHSNSCNSTISSPGISPEVITVGALDDRGTVTANDDRVYAASSRGEKNGGKPDLIAEGVNVLAPLAEGSKFAEGLSKSARYLALAGSSQAAPVVSGTVALMLQVNPNLSPKEAKSALKRTADKLEGVPKFAQGSGRVDLDGAVASAERRRG